MSETFLVRKRRYAFPEPGIERFDEDVVRQQALNDGAAVLVVGQHGVMRFVAGRRE